MRNLKLFILTIGIIGCSLNLQAQEVEEPQKTTFAVNLIHNSVAGFYPVFLGSIGVKENLNLTFYSVFWTNPSFGTLAAGNDLWLETGLGLGFNLLDNKLLLNPSLAFTHGKFLSGGETTALAEGVVPSVMAIYNSDVFELEVYVAQYQAIRKMGPISRDFLLNWVVPGVKLTKHFSAGAYYEQFVLTRVTEGNPESIYQWLGAYAKVTVNKGHTIRLAAGKNLYTDSGTADEFYKISVLMPF